MESPGRPRLGLGILRKLAGWPWVLIGWGNKKFPSEERTVGEGGGGGGGEMRTEGESVWRPWAAILVHTKALPHNAIKLLLLFIPKGPF